jgi:hypothetical protein
MVIFYISLEILFFSPSSVMISDSFMIKASYFSAALLLLLFYYSQITSSTGNDLYCYCVIILSSKIPFLFHPSKMKQQIFKHFIIQ